MARKILSVPSALIFLLGLLGCSRADPVDFPTGGDTIRVGTYNVEDLFDGVDDPRKADGPAPSDERLRALATIIQSADCDILALQEVENIEVITWFNSVCLGGMYREAVLIEGNDPRGIDVAVLSKLPLGNVKSFRDREITDWLDGPRKCFSRDLLAVQWTDPRGRTWNLLTTHLKSGGKWCDGVLREVQADAIADICREEGFVNGLGNGLTVLAGDLNAEPWDDALDALSTVPFSDPARDLPRRNTHASGKVLDYILLSPDAEKFYAVGSYGILREFPAGEASDHFLIYLDLEP